jgi:uncharacterized DUF497 family protein
MPKLEFDARKSEWNARERGLSFERAADFEWEAAVVVDDVRRDYGERRLVATGRLDGRLHVMCFVRIADGIRVISLRRANMREVLAYEQAQAADG